MTFPITPLASIHTDPTAIKDAEKQLQLTLQTLEQIFGTLAQQILQGLIESILRALSITNIEKTLEGMLGQVQSGLKAIPGGNIVGELSGDATIAIASVIGLTAYLTNMSAAGLYNAAAGFENLGTSILKNINPSGQFDASQLTGDVNTAITVAGTAIGDVESNASNAVTQITDTVDNAINGAAAATSALGSAVESWISGQWSALTGSSGQATAAQLNSAHAAQAASTSANSSAIGSMSGLKVSSISQALALSGVGIGGSGGLNEIIDLSGYANQPDLSGILTDTTLGGYPALGNAKVADIGVTSGAAAWQSNMVGYDAAYYPTATNSDYQVISAVIASAPGQNGNNFLFGRANAAMDTYVVAALHVGSGGGQAEIVAVVNGTETTLVTVSHTLIIGGVYELVLGQESISNPYEMSLLCNGSVIASYVDNAHVSQVGSTYRYAGLAMASGASGQNPASLSSWGVADNAPPAVIGSGFRAYRSNTTAVSLTNTGVANASLLPSDFFGGANGVTQWITADLAYASATNNQITVSLEGWYQVTICLYQPTHPNCSLAPVLYQNGSVLEVGYYAPGSSSYNSQSTFLVYCAKNDTLQPGYSTNTTGSTISGESTGAMSYWSVTLLNRGTLS